MLSFLFIYLFFFFFTSVLRVCLVNGATCVLCKNCVDISLNAVRVVAVGSLGGVPELCFNSLQKQRLRGVLTLVSKVESEKKSGVRVFFVFLGREKKEVRCYIL